MDTNKIIEEEVSQEYLLESLVQSIEGATFEWKKNAIDKYSKSQQHKLLQSIVEMIPKEKPMNTFSFVLKGEELELYMQHKGFNKCREEFKAKLTINIKEKTTFCKVA